MWLIPFSFGEDHLLTIHFDKMESIAGLRFWNYNKSPEDTYRGVSKRKGALPAKYTAVHWKIGTVMNEYSCLNGTP